MTRHQIAAAPPVIHRGAEHVVVDKPTGLLSVPGRGAETDPAKADCVAARVRAAFPDAEGPLVAHRLDMDTSGCMVLGLTPAAQRSLSMQFEARTVEKTYVALVDGHHEHLMPGAIIDIDAALRTDVDNRPYQIHDPRRGRPARTRALVMERIVRADGRAATRIELRPRTGRSHQLRVHCALPRPVGLAAPILGDRLYGDDASAERLLLHASELAFDDPKTGERVHARSPMPF